MTMTPWISELDIEMLRLSGDTMRGREMAVRRALAADLECVVCVAAARRFRAWADTLETRAVRLQPA